MAWVRVWTGTAHWLWGSGHMGTGLGRTPGRDDGSRMWPLRVWAVTAGWQRAVGWGLAVPLTRLWTPVV